VAAAVGDHDRSAFGAGGGVGAGDEAVAGRRRRVAGAAVLGAAVLVAAFVAVPRGGAPILHDLDLLRGGDDLGDAFDLARRGRRRRRGLVDRRRLLLDEL